MTATVLLLTVESKWTRYWFSRFLQILTLFGKLWPCKLQYILGKLKKMQEMWEILRELLFFTHYQKLTNIDIIFYLTELLHHVDKLLLQHTVTSWTPSKIAEIKFSGIFISTVFFRQVAICFFCWCYDNSGLRFYWTFFIIFSKKIKIF